MRSCFARTETWQQAGKYVSALVSELPKRNGWTIAQHAGDRSPDRTQRLLNRASWDTLAAMSEVRRFGADGLAEAARRGRRQGGLVIAAIDETGQEKAGEATAGVKRQYMGCAGRVANGINTVHVSLVREKTGHSLIGARQWIPREHIEDPVTSLVMGLPLDLQFRTKGQLAMDICADCYADGLKFDFACGDEVYGGCTRLREFFEASGQAYVLRVASSFMITLALGTRVTCADAVKRLVKDKRRWEVRSAGKGSKGERWYAWRRHHRPSEGPHRYPGPAACDARPGPAARPRHDPADRPGGKTPARRGSRPPAPPRAHRPLARLATPSPGPVSLVSPAHPAKPRLNREYALVS